MCADRPADRRPTGLRGRDGTALLNTLLLIVAASIALSAATFLTGMEERASAADARRARLSDAADALAADMEELLVSRAQMLSGDLSDVDLDALASVARGLAAPEGAALDPAGTGYRLVEVRERERIPHDDVPIAAWSDQPRLAYDGTPPVGGLVASRTLVIAAYVTVTGATGGRFRLRRNYAVSRVPPHQHALYAGGDAELCASQSPKSWIGGPVRVDGRLSALACGTILRYAGGIEARDGIAAGEPRSHFVVGRDGQAALSSVSRADAEAAPDASLAPWGGRVRVAAALRGPIGISRLSSASVAGVGECDEVPAAGAVGCGGRSRYYPSLQVQRTSPGAGPEFTVVCGTAYPPGGCAAAAGAITYKPWPFAGPQPGGVAAVDPSNPPFPWSGLLPDARREPRCTATVGGATFRTARCPTNAYGFTVDLGALPALPGGMLSVRRATNQVPGANPGGTQEIVLLTNASALAGPLTVHSDLPVYIAGNFNTAFRGAWNGPPPANIHAPRIVLLPNETSAQLATSAVWDSVARSGSAVPTADPLRAESNVTVYAVLRTGYCRSGGGAYFGGAWEGAPAVLGDWSGVGLRIIGAVEVHDATVDAPGCGAYAAAWNAGAPSGTPTTQPSSRTLLMDDRLLHPAFQPPGSWSHPNVPSAGSSAIPGRTQERQVRASGGTTVVRRTGAAARGLPEVPAAVPLPPLPVLPAAPLPLP